MTLKKTGITIRLFTKPSINLENQWKTIAPEQFKKNPVPQNYFGELFFLVRTLGSIPHKFQNTLFCSLIRKVDCTLDQRQVRIGLWKITQ